MPDIQTISQGNYILATQQEFPQSASEAVDFVTATSGDINSTIDNVSSNSGAWGGSALPISAGPGIKFEMVDNTLVASTDETVLWEGTPTSTITSIQLSEPWSGFKRVKLFGKSEGGGVLYSEFDTNRTNTNINLSNGGFSDWNSNNFFVNVTIPCHFNSSDTISVNSARYVGYWSNSWQAKTVAPNTANIITKVVGINRIAGGN
jgi:hypothetical protein